MLTLNELKIGLERKLLENSATEEGEKDKDAGKIHARQTSVQDAQMFLESLDSDGDGVVNIEVSFEPIIEQQCSTQT